MTTKERSRRVRHLAIYSIGVLLLATAGGFIMAAGQDVGGLLFILSPLLMVLVVRVVLRDGWQDAGLRPGFGRNWGWYLVALLAYPLMFGITIGLGSAAGITTINTPAGGWWALLLAGLAVEVVPRMIYALSEEWGWRGYMEPRLASLGLADMPRHLLVGVVWGVWHFPLILGTDYTTIPLALFLPLFMVNILIMAVIYGQIRRVTNSVWPAVVMHGVANTFGYALLSNDLVTFHNELAGSIMSGTLTMTVLSGLMAVLVWRYTRTQPELVVAASGGVGD